jgi:hypothetical protein
MLQQGAWKFARSLALAVLLVVGTDGTGAEPNPKAPPGKQANPLKALQDAFSKGVTVTAVEPKDLPKEITAGAAKNAPGASIQKAQKQEIRHTMKYVALDKPRVQFYQAVVSKDGKRVRVRLAPDGKKLGSQPVAEAKKDKKEAPADDKKEIEIPQKAKKAVQAIKELYPDAVVKEITTEVYQDPSGTVDVLTYEVEFITKGSKREMVASPEGVIPRVLKPVEKKDLPKVVAEALAKEVPGGNIESAARFEIRAGLQFAPLEKSRVVYRLDLQKDGKPSKLNLRADGTPVPAPVRPGKPRAYLGLAFEKNTMMVSRVVKNGPADQAGVQPGDRVVALGDAKIGNIPDLLKTLQGLKPGTEVKLHVQRGEKALALAVKLGAPQ